MKKHKRKIQTGIVIGIFSVIIIACLISIFSRMYTENKEKEEFRQLAEIVTEDTTDATIEETIKNLYEKRLEGWQGRTDFFIWFNRQEAFFLP